MDEFKTCESVLFISPIYERREKMKKVVGPMSTHKELTPRLVDGIKKVATVRPVGLLIDYDVNIRGTGLVDNVANIRHLNNIHIVILKKSDPLPLDIKLGSATYHKYQKVHTHDF